MRNRLWYELTQAKFNEKYVCLLIAYDRRVLNFFNLIITVFSTAGVMGWKFWGNFPAVSCIIISVISLARLAQPNLIPSDKQIERLDKISDFYFDFYLKLEKVWFDHEGGRISDSEMQTQFHALKQTEREINKIVNENHKKTYTKLAKEAERESLDFFSKSFNT